jgi:hypothetical protein
MRIMGEDLTAQDGKKELFTVPIFGFPTNAMNSRQN